MASRVLAWSWVLAALSLAVGCGGKGGAEPIPERELPNRLVSLFCDSLGSCCRAAGIGFDAEACRAESLAELDITYDSELVAYDAQAAGDCLASFAAQLECGKASAGFEPAPACERVFRGKVPPGQPCSSSQECQHSESQSASCQMSGVTTVCVVQEWIVMRRGQAGEACSATCESEANCVVSFPGGDPDPVGCRRSDGLYCSIVAPGGAGDDVCRPLGEVGASCEDSWGCRDGTFCDFQTRTCVLPRDNGQPCDSDPQCKSGKCRDGLICSDNTVTAEECSDFN